MRYKQKYIAYIIYTKDPYKVITLPNIAYHFTRDQICCSYINQKVQTHYQLTKPQWNEEPIKITRSSCCYSGMSEWYNFYFNYNHSLYITIRIEGSEKTWVFGWICRTMQIWSHWNRLGHLQCPLLWIIFHITTLLKWVSWNYTENVIH